MAKMTKAKNKISNPLASMINCLPGNTRSNQIAAMTKNATKLQAINCLRESLIVDKPKIRRTVAMRSMNSLVSKNGTIAKLNSKIPSKTRNRYGLTKFRFKRGTPA